MDKLRINAVRDLFHFNTFISVLSGIYILSIKKPCTDDPVVVFQVKLPPTKIYFRHKQATIVT